MHAQEYYKHFDINEELDGYENIPTIRNMPVRKVRQRSKKVNPKDAEAIQEASVEIAHQIEGHEEFNFSYKATLYEQGWLLESLGGFYDGRWIDDILRLVKGGKEASVYLCSSRQTIHHHQPRLAAKVYRPRMLRNLRQDHIYREGRSELDIEGRVVLDERMLHAMRKRTAYGQELLHTSWIGHEFKTMQILHAAGVDIPTPYAVCNRQQCHPDGLYRRRRPAGTGIKRGRAGSG
ncbi:MAG: putative RIO-like kinase [Chloroflexi bacterium]|nr:putative RIO-like kinase [Chloroflexota bacterium]